MSLSFGHIALPDPGSQVIMKEFILCFLGQGRKSYSIPVGKLSFKGMDRVTTGVGWSCLRESRTHLCQLTVSRQKPSFHDHKKGVNTFGTLKALFPKTPIPSYF